MKGDSASAMLIPGTIVNRCYMFIEWRGGRHFHLPLLSLFNQAMCLPVCLLNGIMCFARDDDTVLRAGPKPVQRRLGVSDSDTIFVAVPCTESTDLIFVLKLVVVGSTPSSCFGIVCQCMGECSGPLLEMTTLVSSCV